MTKDTFNEVIEKQIQECFRILKGKAEEYASSKDRLHNFAVASKLRNTTKQGALAGMMAKHTISIYDMCNDENTQFSVDLWQEKITDHINYLLLLRAIIAEEIEGTVDSYSSEIWSCIVCGKPVSSESDQVCSACKAYGV